MTPPHALGALIVIAFLGAFAGCGDDEDKGGQSTAGGAYRAPQPSDESSGSADAGADRGAKPEGDPAQSRADGTVVKLAGSDLGDALFDGDDQAIYLFDAEQSSEPECYDDCAAAWPPVLTDGEPAAEGPVKQRLLGTTKRDDGTTQVTYDGKPLYYYAHEGPGELRCHNISEFGGLWLALDESGQPLPA